MKIVGLPAKADPIINHGIGAAVSFVMFLQKAQFNACSGSNVENGYAVNIERPPTFE